MDQFLIEDFNRATVFDISCKTKIKNLVANAKVAKVTIHKDSVTYYSIVFSILKKDKPPQKLTYNIQRQFLNNDQLLRLESLLST